MGTGAAARPAGLGVGPTTVGAELELVLVGPDGNPRWCNQDVAADAGDPRVTLEMARWDLECNLSPQPLRGRPWAAWEQEIGEVVRTLDASASRRGARVAAVGILPTLDLETLTASALTDAARYRGLSEGLRRLREDDPFRIRITGEDTLEAMADSIGLQGANTAFLVGLVLELREVAADLVAVLPFELVHRGFYRVAQAGLDAWLPWVDPLTGGKPETIRADAIVERMLPAARRGLARGGVGDDEADRLLGVIAERLAARQTGARWQRRALAALETRLSRADALSAMTRHYVDRFASGEPVHRWSLPR